MTALNLPELRRLLAEATPGPWDVTAHGVINERPPVGGRVSRVCCHGYLPNGRMIVALRNDAPAILDLLDDMATALTECTPVSPTPRYGLVQDLRADALARYRAMCYTLTPWNQSAVVGEDAP